MNPPSPSPRTEHDAWGEIHIPADAPWGAQTQRAIGHFAISTEKMPPELLHALALTKRCAARVNAALGTLERPVADAIAQAAAEVVDGRWPDAFPLSLWQSGSGTQSNMNMNEVIARRASALLGRPVHPNDEVNLGQSSNDTIPTAIHLAALLGVERALQPALRTLRDTLAAKAEGVHDVMKTGRTHLQNALPLTLADELLAWVAQLDQAGAALAPALRAVQGLAIGGTAVGSGANAHPDFGPRMAEALSEATGLPLRRADNPYAAQAAHDALLQLHGALRGLALALCKIADDLRWEASPGLGEWRLPANEPGSSIMPGKVNPTQCESLLMVCAQVMGNDVSIGVGATLGQFQMHAAKPLLAHNLLQSIRLLADGMRSFEEHAVRGMEPDRERIAATLSPAMLQATLLAKRIGHEEAAVLYREVQASGRPLRELVLERGLASAEQFDAWVKGG
ncbi:class II fumarate hydratase [Hydrogenophaga sp. SNF1]|uniref:class II fumarate hydratase n=1 Tax=Hydrogenophaga sp. SNF1 TaxID=3098762 RepID=UPI002ACBE4BC|nr:class II fumarate hydratase [Hydrogenophaga sp. SNF1]WQB85530.1 class II fumarate hydratase [Hydrogenophaga sp. SNF1]